MKTRKQIKTLYELHEAALNRRSVECNGPIFCKRCLPAAVIMNLQGTLLVMMLRKGLYLYEAENKENEK